MSCDEPYTSELFYRNFVVCIFTFSQFMICHNLMEYNGQPVVSIFSLEFKETYLEEGHYSTFTGYPLKMTGNNCLLTVIASATEFNS